MLLSIFLENIKHEILHSQHTSIFISGRLICNLRFADNLIAGIDCKTLLIRDWQIVQKHGMETTMTRVNSWSLEIEKPIIIRKVWLEKINSFRYLGATLSQDASSTTDIYIKSQQQQTDWTKSGAAITSGLLWSTICTGQWVMDVKHGLCLSKWWGESKQQKKSLDLVQRT